MNCCNDTLGTKRTCVRNKDNKKFNLPRKYSKHKCLTTNKKGFTMRSSCAPFIYCKNSKFLYHPNNPNKSFDVYINKNPDDTIPIKYSTINDVKNTIMKLEKLYKTNKYNHKRIWQVGMIMKVRLDAMKKHKHKFKNIKMLEQRLYLATKYFKFLGKRTKVKEVFRRKLIFKF